MTTTMTTRKTERFVKLLASSANGIGEIEISVHKGRKSEINRYAFQRVEQTFTLWKKESEEQEVYTVRMDNPQDHRCDCPGHRHRGHCKHVDSLRALLTTGKL
jgi:hypothetical protein